MQSEGAGNGGTFHCHETNGGNGKLLSLHKTSKAAEIAFQRHFNQTKAIYTPIAGFNQKCCHFCGILLH